MDPHGFGRVGWFVAHGAPFHILPAEGEIPEPRRIAVFLWFESFLLLLMCCFCRDSGLFYADRLQILEFLSDRETFAAGVCTLHAQVNRKLGKRIPCLREPALREEDAEAMQFIQKARQLSPWLVAVLLFVMFALENATEAPAWYVPAVRSFLRLTADALSTASSAFQSPSDAILSERYAGVFLQLSTETDLRAGEGGLRIAYESCTRLQEMPSYGCLLGAIEDFRVKH